ncbi:DUF397 domain-containing protein [Actinomadura sp. 3N508]|uniref:DUF397 domain-containing protein n=1 Tax=Actinomadura sp. 3N508 TaxID=3375153 RepID=UPI003796BBCC
MNPPIWRKSSRSTGGTSEQCVELAQFPNGIAIRDSKAPETGHLTLTPHAFATLLAQSKQDELPHGEKPWPDGGSPATAEAPQPSPTASRLPI